jgi:multidrug efflux pump subunit AcrA (membrane-fusion protein)
MPSRLRTSGLTAIIALSVLVLSCLPCQTSSQIVPTPARTVPVSTKEAQDLVAILGQSLIPDSEGRFTLVVTEEELTSYVALNMEESIIDPQILLTDGQIHIYGTLVSPIEAPVTAVASIELQDGMAHVVIESVSVDGFPIPDTFVEAFAQQTDDLITSALGHENMEISEVLIAEGEMVVKGTVGS